MAGRRQNREEWTNTGSFLHKPQRGWLHPDQQLQPEAGVCYGVRYVGCMEVKVSMKSLDFETRTAVAKESISRVCEAAGLKTATSRKKKDKKINRYLGDQPGMQFAGSNVNLTITTESMSMMIMESGEIIAEHQMPGISFASGGDSDTVDFVAYVAKDAMNVRACYVLECGGGLAQDVITTMGQAFELRFKQYLANRPTAVDISTKFENPMFGKTSDSWGNEPDYYNDRPGAQPPEPEVRAAAAVYSSPNNLPVSMGQYTSVKEKEPLYDNKGETELIKLDDGAQTYDNSAGAIGGGAAAVQTYDNPRGSAIGPVPWNQNNIYDNRGPAASGASTESSTSLDPFDMKPFGESLRMQENQEPKPMASLEDEEWFHGKLSRHEAEDLLKMDGDFLVRESANSPGQYVLSGTNNGKVKHLLLVDPEGVVRTKDKAFDSVSHLVMYHMTRNLPICSQDSELLLRRPVVSSPA